MNARCAFTEFKVIVLCMLNRHGVCQRQRRFDRADQADGSREESDYDLFGRLTRSMGRDGRRCERPAAFMEESLGGAVRDVRA